MTTLADIIRRLDGDGTPGPWRAQDFEDFPGDEGTPILGGGEEGSMSEHLIAYALTLGRTPDADHLLDETQCNADAALIVTLRNHAAEIADALEGVQRVRELHQPADIDKAFATRCAVCQTRQWPCPTIRALDGER